MQYFKAIQEMYQFATTTKYNTITIPPVTQHMHTSWYNSISLGYQGCARIIEYLDNCLQHSYSNTSRIPIRLFRALEDMRKFVILQQILTSNNYTVNLWRWYAHPQQFYLFIYLFLSIYLRSAMSNTMFTNTVAPERSGQVVTSTRK